MPILKEDVPRHVDWNRITFRSGNTMSCVEADEIIEEIIIVLISRELTSEMAKRILEETISSIDSEFVLEKRKISGEII